MPDATSGFDWDGLAVLTDLCLCLARPFPGKSIEFVVAELPCQLLVDTVLLPVLLRDVRERAKLNAQLSLLLFPQLDPLVQFLYLMVVLSLLLAASSLAFIMLGKCPPLDGCRASLPHLDLMLRRALVLLVEIRCL